MTRIATLRPKFVDYIPEVLDSGVLYISRRYRTASHLCCCGCGLEVVTPLNPAKWTLTESDRGVSLTPSVGNWSFPCKSHYIVTNNNVRWALGMSAAKIAAVQASDRRAVELHAERAGGLLSKIADVWNSLLRAFGLRR